MAELVSSLAFLIVLDVALAVTLILGHRVTHAPYLKCGFYMMCFETARQVLSAVIARWPEIYILQIGSSLLDFGCAFMMTSAVFGVADKRMTKLQGAVALGVYLSSLIAVVLFPMQVIPTWLIANIAPVSLHVAMIVILLMLPRRSIASIWLTGIVVLSMLFRLAMPFAVTVSESLFGLAYLLDSFVIVIVGATLGSLAVESLAERFKKQKEYETRTAALIRTILDVAYDAFISADANGAVRVWNRTAADTFGWTAEEATGKYVDELVPGMPRLPGRFGVSHRISTKTRTGEPITIDVVTLAADRPAGRIFVYVVRDVSAHLKAESELRLLEEQVEQARRMESLGAFASGVAHDYNNILAAIMGFADLALEDAPPGSSIEQNLRDLMDAAERGSELTHRILEYAGRTSSKSTRFDAAMEAQAMASLLKSVTGKNASLEWETSAGPLPVVGDKSQFGQILLNLVANASDALEGRPGSIRVITDCVSAGSPDAGGYTFDHRQGATSYVRVRVTDTGCGIAPQNLNKVLDPFFTTKPTGRGFGMATVAAILRAHHGALKIESEPGTGTTVSVLLPLAPTSDPKPHAEPPNRAMDSGLADFTKTVAAGDRVLVVDDEESVRNAVAKILRNAGFDVLTAADGIECLDRLEEANGSVRLVVLDCNMPRMDGNAALEEILRRNAHMPVLMSSGRPSGTTSGRSRPNVRFIRKPYRAKDLLTQVGEMIQN